MNVNSAAILIDSSPGCHIVYPYTDENLVSQAVCLFASAGLRKNEGVVLIMSQVHFKPILSRLRTEGIGVEERQQSGQLACITAEELLRVFMVNDMPDTKLF